MVFHAVQKVLNLVLLHLAEKKFTNLSASCSLANCKNLSEEYKLHIPSQDIKLGSYTSKAFKILNCDENFEQPLNFKVHILRCIVGT